MSAQERAKNDVTAFLPIRCFPAGAPWHLRSPAFENDGIAFSITSYGSGTGRWQHSGLSGTLTGEGLPSESQTGAGRTGE